MSLFPYSVTEGLIFKLLIPVIFAAGLRWSSDEVQTRFCRNVMSRYITQDGIASISANSPGDVLINNAETCLKPFTGCSGVSDDQDSWMMVLVIPYETCIGHGNSRIMTQLMSFGLGLLRVRWRNKIAGTFLNPGRSGADDRSLRPEGFNSLRDLYKESSAACGCK